jgi:hypothetical protein
MQNPETESENKERGVCGGGGRVKAENSPQHSTQHTRTDRQTQTDWQTPTYGRAGIRRDPTDTLADAFIIFIKCYTLHAKYVKSIQKRLSQCERHPKRRQFLYGTYSIEKET